MNNTILANVNSIKDLGVDISSVLGWNDHISRIVNKGNTKLGIIKRTVGYHAPVNVTKTLYSALVRSNLEYGSVVWGGLSSSNAKKIEGVQRRATKYILGYQDLEYKDRLNTLNLMPLSFRREIGDLVFFFRCLHGDYELDTRDYVSFVSPTGMHTRSASDTFKLKVNFCKTESHKMFFFNRIVPIWNQLPLAARSSVVVLLDFKAKVSDFYHLKLDSKQKILSVKTQLE